MILMNTNLNKRIYINMLFKSEKNQKNEKNLN